MHLFGDGLNCLGAAGPEQGPGYPPLPQASAGSGLVAFCFSLSLQIGSGKAVFKKPA